MTEIGVIFKKKRLELGLTQQKLAEKACVDITTVNRIEKGKYKPIKGTAELICSALEIPFESVSDKIYGKEDYGRNTRK